jgi:hypothetical protein
VLRRDIVTQAGSAEACFASPHRLIVSRRPRPGSVRGVHEVRAAAKISPRPLGLSEIGLQRRRTDRRYMHVIAFAVDARIPHPASRFI